MNLNAVLHAFTAENAGRFPAETVAEIERSIAELAASELLRTAHKTGDLAPDFTLAEARGGEVSLSDLLRRGPALVTFYRGIWCPYCNIALRAYQEILPEIHGLGAELVAISPQTPDNSLSTAEKNALAFPVLSDPGNRVAERFGLAYEVPPIVRALTARSGFPLPQMNGAEDWRLPLTATYIVAPDRRITFADVGADFRRRVEPAQLLDGLRALAAAPRVA